MTYCENVECPSRRDDPAGRFRSQSATVTTRVDAGKVWGYCSACHTDEPLMGEVVNLAEHSEPIIVIEGGLVQYVINLDNYSVMDCDTDGAEPDELTWIVEKPTKDDPNPEPYQAYFR